jgi:hypothetical protein
MSVFFGFAADVPIKHLGGIVYGESKVRPEFANTPGLNAPSASDSKLLAESESEDPNQRKQECGRTTATCRRHSGQAGAAGELPNRLARDKTAALSISLKA